MSENAVTLWTLQRRSDTEQGSENPCKKVACLQKCCAEHQCMRVDERKNLPEYAGHQVQLHHKNLVRTCLCPKRAKQSGETKRREGLVGTNQKRRGLENGPHVAGSGGQRNPKGQGSGGGKGVGLSVRKRGLEGKGGWVGSGEQGLEM